MKRILSLLVVAAPLTSAHADKSFNSGKGATWDCATDDEVSINTSSGTYNIKGACKDINVNGSGLTISIESVKDLSINGAKNTVTAGTVNDVNITGSDNTFTWSHSFRGSSANINNVGSRNTVKHGDGAAAPAPAAPTAPAGATVLDCGAKKNAAITKSNGVYAVTGACDKVALSGSNNVVTIESTKNLAVSGGSNTVTVAAVDKIAATGKNNTVTWAAGISGAAPKVASSGKGNTITQAGSTPPSTATTAPATAVPAGAIDCGKQASHTIGKNDGTYNFVGKCELITIDGNNNKVTVESAGGIAVNGNNNTVDATSVEKLGVIGNDNAVRYKKGVTSAKPKLANVGSRNKVSVLK